MTGSDDLFGDDEDAERAADEFERLHQALMQRIEDFIQAEDIAEPMVVGLLIASTIQMRMAAYGMYVEKPSVAGLKLDLDRFRQEVDEIVRDAKKGADEYIKIVKEARARMESEDDEEDDDEE